ncbi:MAG: hypothetical protein HUU46_11495 [Candidatus Hydrogenedentes bacterium]|nr:hypothetical protein [Candidatus Hydrogenedentota bacterium]
MLGRSLKMAFWIFHDHLGLLLLVNLIWAVAVAAPIAIALPPIYSGDFELALVIGAPAFYIALFLLNPVVGVGIVQLIKVFIDTRDGSLADFLDGIRRYGLRAALLGSCYAVAVVALGTSTWFYASKLQSTAPILGYGISALALWCLAMLGLTALFALPALAQRKTGVFATMKLAALLVLANPLLAVGMAIQCLMLAIVTACLLPLFFAGFGSAILCIQSAAYELLSRKYAANDGSTPGANDDYLNRGLRDLFFPWKS